MHRGFESLIVHHLRRHFAIIGGGKQDKSCPFGFGLFGQLGGMVNALHFRLRKARRKKGGLFIFRANWRTTHDLQRRELEDKATISALHFALVNLISEYSKRDKSDVLKELSDSQKVVFQALLEAIEKKAPNRAGRLDNRGLDEVL